MIMTEQPASRWRNFIENPVTVKELRSRMRGRRAFVVLTIHVLAVSGLISLVYLVYAAATDSMYGPDARQAGKTIFFTIVMMQTFLVALIGPSFTAGAISGEKERQTYDLLRTTLLSAKALVWGKLVSALSYVLLLILALIPLQSIAFLLGGVALTELLLSQLLILTAAVAYALVGLFYSSLFRSTLASSVATLGTTIALTIGTPLIGVFAASMIGSFLFGFSSPSWLVQASLIYLGLILSSTNLPLTLILSEVFLLQEGTLFYFTQVIDGRTVYIFSPWWAFVLLHLFLAVLLYRLTVWRVRQVPDK
jgi:ABC-2 type transport system permease protein